MAKGIFTYTGTETYNPEYGGVEWKQRLNRRLEATDTEISPVFYREGDDPTMQISQENTFIYINAFVDEMDLIVVNYEFDPDGLATNYFRETIGDKFNEVVDTISMWSMRTVTLYPIPEVVEAYEAYNTPTIPDYFDINDLQ